MSGKSVFAMTAVLLCAALPVAAAAESEESAGVVTTVNGNATLIRAAALAQPVSLRMRDEIFLRDRIQTQPRSLVRVLLGGKALITVRELSVLTVTEEANRVTVDLQSGKVGVAVVKSRMRPGEVIEIRSPNATAAVRGTVFVVDVDPLPAGKAAATITTRIHLFQGALDVSARHGAPQPPVRLAAMQSVVVAGNALGAVRPLSRQMVAALTADLTPSQVQDTEAAPSEFTGQLVAREQGRAIMLASSLLPVGGTYGPAPLKNVKGTIKAATGTIIDGLESTVTNLTGTTAETLERLMDTLGIGNEGPVGGVVGAVDDLGNVAGNTVGALGSTLGNTGDGVGSTLGNTLGGGSNAVSPAGPAVAPIATPVAPPIVTPVAPPIVGPIAPPVLNPLTPVLNPIVNPLVNVLGGKK